MVAIRRLNTSRKRLILALLAGFVAALLMFFHAGNLEARANSAQSAAMEEYGGAQTEVLVATRNLLAGEELTADNATMMPWLSDLLPQGAITDSNEAFGKTLSVSIWANEPILSVKLGEGEELIQVPDGLSAVSIPISDDMAVGGSILPGSSVDVYAIGSTQVTLVIADVLVLEASNGVGVKQGSSDEEEEAGVVLGSSARAALKWVTLAISDDMVADLLTAARDNKLSIVLPGQNAGSILDQDTSGDEEPENTESAEGTAGAEAGGQE